MTTIREVAEHAGVSVATVSRVINKTGVVSPALQERVLRAMQELNYQPSALARSLRRQETHTVGVLVPQLDHPFFGALSFAIEKTLAANDYYTFICSAEESRDKEDAYINMLLRQRVDGVILVPTGHSTENVQQLVERRIPVVLVDRDLPDLEINRVLSNNFQGGYDGARHLLELGHRCIGVIGGPAHSDPIMHRIRGIRKAVADFGVETEPIIQGDDILQQFEMGYTAARELLLQTPRPTAIFALTDVIAVGALHAAAEFGLTPGQDLSLVGFDDIPLASYVIPALTTVAQPIYSMGQTAAQLLLNHIANPDMPIETVVLETKLIIRDSTAPPP